MVPTVSSVFFQGRQPLEAGAPVSAWRALQTDEVTGFRADDGAVDEKESAVWPIYLPPDRGADGR